MATVQTIAGEQRMLLCPVSWATYEALLKDLDSPGVRLTYDNGRLEIMTLGHGHEQFAKLIGRMIELLTFELNVPIHSGRSTTFKREAKKRGLEPDECYWIQNELAMRGKKDFDIESDPPPDLAIEVDITSSSIDRMSIYASLGVKEIWRFHDDKLTVYQLRPGGTFSPCEHSPAFPYLPVDELLRFLRDSDMQDETSLMRSFTAWVRETVRPEFESHQAGRRSPSKKRRPKK